MRFEPTRDQRDFAAALDRLIAASEPVGVVRSWAAGEPAPGIELWTRLAELGVTALATEASAVEVAIAFEVLGRHAVPGPWVESAAYLPVALGREVEGVATVAVPPHAPFALDADVAGTVLLATDDGLAEAEAGTMRTSVDRSRRLFEVHGLGAPPLDRSAGPATSGPAFDLAALATAAYLLGCGERVLADSVAYARQRRQFGREIGSFQAIKHQLADVRIALDFARPLVFGAAVAPGPRAVSAAKVLAGEAAYTAARTGLQVHGAIGYTQELDLSIWLTKIRALVTAWGTPAFHRTRVLDSLAGVR